MATPATPPALASVTRASTQAREAQEAAAQAMLARDRAILAAADAGHTYPQIAEASGLTRDRVSQVLQFERAERRLAATTPA